MEVSETDGIRHQRLVGFVSQAPNLAGELKAVEFPLGGVGFVWSDCEVR